MRKTKTKSKEHYIDNQKLYDCYVEWYKNIEAAKAQGLPEPPIPEYIIEAVMLVPKKLATKMNFSGYYFKQDMIGDAIENILLYLKNFDPQKSKNPFAYFSQIAYYAFLRRIAKEKKQMHIKQKLVQDLEEEFDLQDHDCEKNFKNQILEMLRLEHRIEENLITKEKKKKRKVKIQHVHDFV